MEGRRLGGDDVVNRVFSTTLWGTDGLVLNICSVWKLISGQKDCHIVESATT